MNLWGLWFSKIARKIFVRISALKVFIASFWASWNLFEASCSLPYSSYYSLSPPEVPKRFKEAPRNLLNILNAEILTIFCCYFGKWMSS
jgi:hypothetical protein